MSVLEALLAQLGEAGEAMRRMLLDIYLSEGAQRMAEFRTGVERGDRATDESANPAAAL